MNVEIRINVSDARSVNVAKPAVKVTDEKYNVTIDAPSLRDFSELVRYFENKKDR